MLRFVPIFVTTLFISLHFGALLYINSSFLGRFYEPGAVSLLFILAAIGNIILFLLTPRFLNWFGKHLLFFIFLLFTSLGVFGLALAATATVAAVSFLIYASVLFMNYYCLDIFLEELSTDSKTGEIRGIYFTLVNVGIALGPLLVALLAVGDTLNLVYWAAALLLIPPILFAVFSFKLKRGLMLHKERVVLPFRKWWRSRDIRRVTLAKVVLETFFASMVIYTPIYLHGSLGFSWPELGVIFTVALLPFILFEWPVGELADRFLGEKEIMSLGLFITGTSLLVMPFLGKVFFVWMAILFLSRVGASFIEITTESYFFKQIDASDTGLLSIFRLARPVSIVFGAALGALSINLFSFEKIFFVLAVVVFFGLHESLYLKDTR
ncbi:MAG: MFS transporter [bacterium]|nr:MFS transporter [bacterium]